MRYFIVSDIHSFYDELIAALKEKGFNKEEDTLVVAGDIFDRGSKPRQVYNFLKKLKNKILIKGNHEELYLDLLKRGYPEWHDYHNGTEETFAILFGEDESGFLNISKAKKSVITKFIKSITTSSVEIGNYIICHSRPGDTWGNPYVQSIIPGKTIVFGHWHTSDGPNYTEGKLEDNIFYGDGIIGIDAGVSYRNGKFHHKQNVLVIESDEPVVYYDR